MLLSPYGLREWLTITLIALVLGAAAAWFDWWWVLAVVAVLWFAGVAFFRDPPRRIGRGLETGAMLSPADGTISAVERVDQHEATGGPALVIRIFLSVLNVHVNRAPCNAKVLDISYKPGKFLDARKEVSARVNESNLLTLETPDGDRIGVRQISGAIARRIVCAVKPGDHLEQGERFGMIKFGSTTELILPRPDDVDVRIQVGDKVKAGVQVLAVLKPR